MVYCVCLENKRALKAFQGFESLSLRIMKKLRLFTSIRLGPEYGVWRNLIGPEKRLRYLKKSVPDAVSPIHDKFLKLESEIGPGLLEVTVKGDIILHMDEGDPLQVICLRWNSEDQCWYDPKWPDRGIYHLKDYLFKTAFPYFKFNGYNKNILRYHLLVSRDSGWVNS